METSASEVSHVVLFLKKPALYSLIVYILTILFRVKFSSKSIFWGWFECGYYPNAEILLRDGVQFGLEILSFDAKEMILTFY